MKNFLDTLLEKNCLPDAALRWGIRRLLAARLRQEYCATEPLRQKRQLELASRMAASAVALNTVEANSQHYEVPTRFYQLALGPHLKYSCAWWPDEIKTLGAAEEAMLGTVCKRAQLQNGQSILELGCGWGSLTLYMAQAYPQSFVTGVSNSATQKVYIEEEARRRGLSNVRILTCDMNEFSMGEQVDRIVSVEMFEHMRNWRSLLERARGWIKDDGKMFIHIFTHCKYTYFFENQDQGDWMSRYFFTGGIMPCDDLLYRFQDHFTVRDHWRVNGRHYGKTARAWLENMDAHRAEVMALFKQTYGAENTVRWWVYWRVFFMACEELWNYNEGREWLVSHYLLEPKAR